MYCFQTISYETASSGQDRHTQYRLILTGMKSLPLGPNGVEGLRAIGTKSPLSTVSLAVGQVFKCYANSEEQQVQIEQMIAEIAKMNTDNWDIAEWTFSIKNQ